MAESNNLVFLDTDVLINWLTHEKESQTGKPLWPSVENILINVQTKKVRGAASIISIMELRSFLSRDKKLSKTLIEKEITKINSLLNILIPNDITILLANQIQYETTFTPIDAIQVALVYENLPATFISRDKELLLTSKKFIATATPEEILTTLL